MLISTVWGLPKFGVRACPVRSPCFSLASGLVPGAPYDVFKGVKEFFIGCGAYL